MKIDLFEWLEVAGVNLFESDFTGEFVLINYNIVRNSGVIKGIQLFDDEDGMIEFLRKEELKDTDYSRAFYVIDKLNDEDLKILGLPEDGDYKKEDFKDYVAAVKKISNDDYKKLSFFKKLFMKRDDDPDNYDWQILFSHGEKVGIG